MMTINYSQAFGAVLATQKEINTGLRVGEWKLKSNVTETFRTIIRMIAQRFRSIDPANPPRLRITNGQIAAMRGVSIRTVQRHRQILEKLELIDTRFRGCHHPYDLWVRDVKHLGVVKSVEGSPASAVSKIINQFSSKDKKAGIHEPGLPLKNHNRAGGKVDDLRSSGALLREGNPDHTPEQAPVHARQDANSAELERYCSGLWRVANQFLWPHQNFTAEQTEMIIGQIRRHYLNCKPHRWAYLNEAHYKMLDLVYDFLKRDSTRFVPPPWFYFDPNQKSGFIGVWKWLNNNKAKQKAWKAQNLLLDLQDKYRRNLQKPPSRQRSAQELVTTAIQKLSLENRPDLVRRFEARNNFV